MYLFVPSVAFSSFVCRVWPIDLAGRKGKSQMNIGMDIRLNTSYSFTFTVTLTFTLSFTLTFTSTFTFTFRCAGSARSEGSAGPGKCR
jgi:hypothetical protein